MASSGLPLVAVAGATGQQGGSVVDHLLRSGRYRVRGLTRDPNSNAAIALKKRGVEVVKAQADSLPELTSAYQGAHAVFAVTNFWDPDMKLDGDKETQQGKNHADAAVAAGVQVFVWSSLHDAHSIIRKQYPQADWDAEHYTSKFRVEEYVRTLPMTSAYVYAGYYYNNFQNFPPFGPTRLSPNSVEWAVPVRADVGLPLFDVADTGLFVLQILADPRRFKDQRVLMAVEYLTQGQIAAIYSKVTGEKASSRFVPMNPAFPHPIKTTYRWFNEFGYYAGEDITETPGVPRSQLTTWEQYLIKSKWRVPQ